MALIKVILRILIVLFIVIGLFSSLVAGIFMAMIPGLILFFLPKNRERQDEELIRKMQIENLKKKI